MTAEENIKNKAYYIADDGDVVCLFKQGTSSGAFILGLSSEPLIISSIKVTEDVVYDCVHLTKAQFSKKHSLLEKAPLTIGDVFHQIRSFIVDEKVPIPKKRSKGTRSKRINTQVSDDVKMSRKDQIKQILNDGERSPSKIAKMLDTNAGYVSRLIKQIENEINN